jgi:hypothetical protein
MKRVILTIAVAAALGVGGMAAAGLAAPPPNNPGSPGDDCSHGNSNKPCRDDPSPNGQDCEDHGKARGNEDHCDAADTTDTTTTDETTTTEETTSTDTTTTSPESTATEPDTTTTSETPGPAPTPQHGGQPVTTTVLQNQLDKQAKRNGAPATTPATPSASAAGELPYTGLPLGGWVALGLGLVGSGLTLRRRSA